MLDCNIRSLEVFYAVAKHNSFSAAANELYISQSSVSKIVSRLESTLNLQLFNRSSHGISLTAAGQYLYGELDHLLPSICRLFRDMASFGQLQESIGFSIPASSCKRLIKAFSSDYPNIHFDTSQNYDSFLSFHALTNGDVSLWIAHSYLIPKDYGKHIRIVPLYPDPIYVVLPVGHPMATRASLPLAVLSQEQLLCHSAHTLAMAKALSINHGVNLHIADMRNIISNRAECLRAILAGEGISLFYKSDFEMLSSRKIVCVPLEEGADCSIVAAYEKSRQLQSHESAFLANFIQYWEDM